MMDQSIIGVITMRILSRHEILLNHNIQGMKLVGGLKFVFGGFALVGGTYGRHMLHFLKPHRYLD